MDNADWVYLGDGLYVTFDGYHICLAANSYTNPTDRVYLDPHTLASFMRYIANLKKGNQDDGDPIGEEG